MFYLRRICFLGMLVTATSCPRGVIAGPYPPAAGQTGSDAIINTDPRFVEWASGYSNYVEGNPINATYATPTGCLGPASTSTTSHLAELGDGGQITLSFATPIIAGSSGPDFAVFGNALDSTYLKLAYVDVSEDGVHWYREPNYSLTPGTIATFGNNMDPTNISGLAGKYMVGYGVPFSLTAAGLSEANYVRLVDIVGDGSNLDSAGNPIYDPYPNSNGFNVSGVGVINTVPEPGTLSLAIAAMAVGLLLSARRTRSRFVKGLCRPAIILLAIGLGCRVGEAPAATIDFSDLNLSLSNTRAVTQYAPNGTTVTGRYWDGPDPAGRQITGAYGDQEILGKFASGGVSFQNLNSLDYSYWEGFAYSNVVDTSTPGYTNQYASMTGGGIRGPGSNYAVGYEGATLPTITLPTPTTVLSADIANTTYAYYSMLNGDSFGDTAFSSSDSFQLSIQGFDATGQPTSGQPVVVNLAAGTNILTSWSDVNLSGLGNDVKSLEFSLTSTQPGSPSYFALGELTVAPEPSTLALLGVACLAGLVARRRRRF
jgi:hypothetical protein